MRILALTLLLAGSVATAAPGPWAELAAADLRGIHDLLEANHPGPVDPQNPGYRRWLDGGLAEALGRAAAARSYDDYERALRFYANGFRDGHVALQFQLAPRRYRWPGFLLGADARVAVAEGDAAPLLGASLQDCDGCSLDALMAEHLDPYHWNRDIPHQRPQHLPQLLLRRLQDPLPIKRCRFRQADGRVVEQPLGWLALDAADAEARLRRADAEPHGELGLRRVGEVWFVFLPSFQFEGAEVQAIQGLVETLKARAPELHRAGRVVIDVRGNGGGNSSWGDEVVKALWGEAALRHVQSRFDDSTDWRASPANLAVVEGLIDEARENGLADALDYRRRVRAALRDALQAGRPLAAVPEPPEPAAGPAPASPFTGRVFLLTDTRCFSACLDFADVLRRLPGVRHVGLPTQADAVYIDNTAAPLPSGIARLSYSMKVYRHRVRANNEWYEPELRWPGGPMQDEAVAAWVRGL